MPAIYLSPSVDEAALYISGGNEEYYMNQIVDAMIPYLRASGIDFVRSSPGNTPSQVITESNSRNYDLHFALHSNSSPENMRGILQGPDVYYNAASKKGQESAYIIEGNLKKIYSNPKLVMAIPTTMFAELSETKAPAIMIEIAYHDNYLDSEWVKENIDEIAKNLTASIAQFLKVPFKNA